MPIVVEASHASRTCASTCRRTQATWPPFPTSVRPSALNFSIKPLPEHFFCCRLDTPQLLKCRSIILYGSFLKKIIKIAKYNLKYKLTKT